MREWANRFLYLPPRLTLVLNAVFFAVLLTLTFVFGLYSDKVESVTAPFLKTDQSKGWTIFILFAVLVGSFALIYGKTEKYFVCCGQCASAALGTTLVVTLFYSGIWGLVQIGRGKQGFVLFAPASWSCQSTLDDLKYGSLLFLFSSVSLVGSLAISGRAGYDFTTFTDDWRVWSGSVGKLKNNEALTEEEHNGLIAATESLLKKAAEIGDHAQPISKAAVESVREPLRMFKDWYQKQTEITYAQCQGLDAAIRPQAQKILRLC